MFSSIVFWCEFPEKVDWKNLKIPFPCSVYIAVSSRKEFEKIKKGSSKNIQFGVWPVLSKIEGYWFSGFCGKESIQKLLEYKGLDIKIDIEPPFPFIKFSSFGLLKYGVKMFLFRRAKNNNFLIQTIEELAKSSQIIISGLPLPEFLSRKYGDDIRKDLGGRNFFIYKTFFSGFLGKFLERYYRWFIRSRLKIYKERAMFAIGCTGSGILGNEPVYSDLKSFEEDLKWFSQCGVKNLVVFNLEGILMRRDSEEWMKMLSSFVFYQKGILNHRFIN